MRSNALPERGSLAQVQPRVIFLLLQEFGQRLYEAAAQADRDDETEAGTPDDDEVVDAEIIEDEAAS